MCSVQETQRIDQELSSELVESPINPAFTNISAPFMGKKNPSFLFNSMERASGNGGSFIATTKFSIAYRPAWLKSATNYRRLLALELGWPSTEE